MTEWTRPSRGQLLLGGLFAVLVVVWPLFARWMVEQFGVRALAGSLLAVGALSLRAANSALPPDLSYARSDSVIWFALVLGALVTASSEWLLALPAAVYLAIARILERSARSPESLIERVAFWMQPYAPEFIRPYCRGVTRFWAGVFLANAIGIAALALFAPVTWWQAYTGWMVWLVFLGISVIEFAVRKAHFRNYDNGPIDLLFEKFFPSDRTEMGRRAMEWKAQMRRSLGRPERGR